LGIGALVDAAIFCTDVGWRKPARQVFQHVLDRLEVKASEALFVGDDRRWDVEGPRRVGIESILIERGATGKGSVSSLEDVLERLDWNVAAGRSERELW
jgi:putative hydrolase of the HAD superfamily